MDERGRRAGGGTGVRRSVAAAVCALALGAIPAAAAAPSAAPAQRVTLRLVTGEQFYEQPVRGTFTASGALSDHGAVDGLLVPVYRREADGSFGFDAVRLGLIVHGSRGSFSVRGRLDTIGFDLGWRERGTLVVIAASGAYRRLAPFMVTRGINYVGPVTRAVRIMRGQLLKSPGPYPRRAPL
jgi:hypothetical protein